MKFLWIHQNFVGRDQPGNARATLLLDELERRGHEVDLIATTRSYLGNAGKGPAEGVTARGGIRLHRLPAPQGTTRGQEYVGFLREAVPYALRLGRPDAIFASSPGLPQVAPALALSAIWRVPLALEIRDLWPAFLEEGGLLPPGPMRFAMRALEGAAMRHASEVIVVGPAYLPYLEALGVSPERLTVAPTGGSREERTAADEGEAWRAASGLSDRVVFLYAGSFNEAYDLRAVLDAARLVAPQRPMASWVFVGGGRGATMLHDAAEKYPFIRVLPSVRRDEMGVVLAGSDVAINPHADWPLLGITISGKLFDAMSAGIPVLSLRQGVMGAMIRASGGGVVAEEPTAEALARAAIHLMDLGQHGRQSMGNEGQKWLLREMPAEAMASRVVDALERLAPGSQRRRVASAALGGLADALGERGARAVAAVYGAQVDAVAERTLREWLSSPPSPRPSSR